VSRESYILFIKSCKIQNTNPLLEGLNQILD